MINEGAIQVLRNAVRIVRFPGKKHYVGYGATLALRGGRWVSNILEKSVTFLYNLSESDPLTFSYYKSVTFMFKTILMPPIIKIYTNWQLMFYFVTDLGLLFEIGIFCGKHRLKWLDTLYFC